MIMLIETSKVCCKSVYYLLSETIFVTGLKKYLDCSLCCKMQKMFKHIFSDNFSSSFVIDQKGNINITIFYNIHFVLLIFQPFHFQIFRMFSFVQASCLLCKYFLLPLFNCMLSSLDCFHLLIARLARSDPRNSFLCRPCIFLFVLAFCSIYSNFTEFCITV